MNLEIETDKRLNVYRIWSGKQLVLCKNQTKSIPFNGKNWVILWPTIKGENGMLRRNIPTEQTDFLPSDKGFEYLKSIQGKTISNCFIAQVEYHEINGKSINLWKRLEANNEFELWDLVIGPIKYFKKKNRQLLAIYRIFKMPHSINVTDIIPDRNGNLPTYHKKLNSELSQTIMNSVSQFEPIISDNEFLERKRRILDIIKETRYDPPYIPKNDLNDNRTVQIEPYVQKDIRTETRLNDLDNQESKFDENKYCIYCGHKLPMIAMFCSRCGKKAFK